MNTPILKPNKLSANTATAEALVGSLRTEWSTTNNCFKTYKYVKAIEGATITNGTFVNYLNALGTLVTNVVLSSLGRNLVAGVGIGTITALYYGWIQVEGYHPSVACTGAAAGANLKLIASATDGTVEALAAENTAQTYKLVGVTTAAVNAGFVGARINCL